MTAHLCKIWKLLPLVLAVPGLATWIYSGTIWNQYLHTLPRSPDPRAGRVFAGNIHGIVIFQTRAEQLRLDLMKDISLGAFFLGAVIAAIVERDERCQKHRLPS
jgi:hypothetical protein